VEERLAGVSSSVLYMARGSGSGVASVWPGHPWKLKVARLPRETGRVELGRRPIYGDARAEQKQATALLVPPRKVLASETLLIYLSILLVIEIIATLYHN
jgi:hypothetical protein